MTTVPQSFLRKVTIDIEGDILTASACIGGRCYQKTVDLAPLTEFIAEQLRSYHASLHGDDAIAGLGDFFSKAKGIAKRVASSKAVRSVYKAARPLVKSAVKELPGGETAFAVASKTYDMVKDAKKGNPTALKALSGVVAKANAGDPLAQQIAQTAKSLATMHDMKAAKDPTAIANRVASIERTLHPLHRVSGWEISPDDFDYDMDTGDVVGFSLKGLAKGLGRGVKKVAKYSPPGLAYRGAKKLVTRKAPQRATVRAPGQRLAPSRAAAFRPSRAIAPPVRIAPQAQSRITVPAAPSGPATFDITESHERILASEVPASTDIRMPGEMMDFSYDDYYEDYEDDGAYYEDDYYADDEFAGWKQWMYHRPYRGVAQAALQGDYGLSGSLRSLYANGLDIIKARAGA